MEFPLEHWSGSEITSVQVQCFHIIFQLLKAISTIRNYSIHCRSLPKHLLSRQNHEVLLPDSRKLVALTCKKHN